jgi:hypothetical protein
MARKPQFPVTEAGGRPGVFPLEGLRGRPVESEAKACEGAGHKVRCGVPCSAGSSVSRFRAEFGFTTGPTYFLHDSVAGTRIAANDQHPGSLGGENLGDTFADAST